MKFLSMSVSASFYTDEAKVKMFVSIQACMYNLVSCVCQMLIATGFCAGCMSQLMNPT